MSIEIERKFLVNKNLWEKISKPSPEVYRQGYITKENSTVIRVRIVGENSFLTIKSRNKNFSRIEFEYQIPYNDAIFMLNNICFGEIIKKRYKLEYKGKIWEIDEFLGLNEGLLLAEIELLSEEEVFEKPEWVDKEVTYDDRYYNSYLAVYPYTTWNK